MTKDLADKIMYTLLYVLYILSERIINDQTKKNPMADKFLEYNNRRIIKYFGKEKTKEIAILLPHCIQNYDCPFRITSNINNCKSCGKCKIADILSLQDKYNVYVKVATGGTLARLFVKEKRPKVIIAVACKRDLISGIYDTFPMRVYGVYNKILNMPCVNTDVDVEKIEKVIKFLRGDGKGV